MGESPQFLLSLEALRARQSSKWTVYPPDVLPAWVADMDYALAPPLQAAIEARVAGQDLGYPRMYGPSGLAEVFAARAARKYGSQVDPARVEFLSDVVQGLYLALLALTEAGDGVLVQTPIYPPFLHAVAETGRRLVDCPLAVGPQGFTVDFDSLDAACDAGVRVLMLCHPHNPSGRAFTRGELEGFAALVRRHDLLVVSDEIHADLVLDERQHIPFATLGEDIAARTLTLTSASKAFNIAGLCLATAVFGSQALQTRFARLPGHVRGGRSTLGMAAAHAAWTAGDAWLDAVKRQLRANRDRVAAFVAERWPAVRHFPPEATYLSWLDCRGLELGEEPYRFFLREAKVALSDGPTFGAPGQGCTRLNFATSPEILEEILSRLDRALATAGKSRPAPR